jgi:hypothetical protein
MNTINIVDNFLTNEELTKLKTMVDNFKWTYGHHSVDGGTNFWSCGLDDNSFFTEHIFKKIENYCNKKFIIERIYANGQTYGLDGSYHVDDIHPDCYTFLLYVSDITRDNVHIVDGYTLFKDGDKIACIEPILNRGVLFKSNIIHKGLGPSRLSNLLRVSIAFKLKEIK